MRLQLVFVANFGKQEKYFFMRMGRSAPTGSGEIWVMAESGEVATDMHNKLNKIVERESEKKRQLGVGSVSLFYSLLVCLFRRFFRMCCHRRK